jgi:hypothetical protein
MAASSTGSQLPGNDQAGLACDWLEMIEPKFFLAG